MDNQLERIFTLIKRTGEKVILISDGVEYVISGLDEYNRLVGGESPLSQLSEAELLDKINRDIMTWRESQKELDANARDFDLPTKKMSHDSFDMSIQSTLDRLSENIKQINDFEPNDTNADELIDWDNDDSGDVQAGLKERPELKPFNFNADRDELNDARIFEDNAESRANNDSFSRPDGIVQNSAFESRDDVDDEIELGTDDFSFSDEESGKTQVNNFGYSNPSDTKFNAKNASNDNHDYWQDLNEQEKNNDDFGYISPPPDKTA